MLAKIIFFVSVSAAILAVILLATVSPLPKRSHRHSPADYDWISLSFYVQPFSHDKNNIPRQGELASVAYVFRRTLTMGLDDKSPVVGSLTGFVLPDQKDYHRLSAFNMVHLALFNLPELSGGSICIEVRQAMRGLGRVERLVIVGGTGPFAYATGNASLVLQRNSRESAYILELTVGLLPDRDPNIIPG